MAYNNSSGIYLSNPTGGNYEGYNGEGGIYEGNTTGGVYEDQTPSQEYNTLSRAEQAALLAKQYRDEALAAKVAAEQAEANAELAETNAETAETNAETAETNAEAAQAAAEAARNLANTYKIAAEAAKTAAELAQSRAETAETNAETAETNAETAEANAEAAQAAAEAARNAALVAETNAETAETNAELAEVNAEAAQAAAEAARDLANTYKIAAQTAKTAAELAETNAETAETNAEAARDAALAAQVAAELAETNAETARAGAETAETNAETAEAGAIAARNAAQAAQASAEAARDATLTAYDNFDDRYLGTKTTDPTLDNDGNALVAGALYFNSTLGIMKVYTGSAWVAAYVSGADYLLKTSNLSDLTNVATARTNLGLGTAATTDSTAYATAAQGTKADTAIQTITSSDASLLITPTGTSIDVIVSADSPASTLVASVRNETGSTLTKGTVVYSGGASGNKMLVLRALATSDATSAQTFGMVTADIPNNQNGYVTISGVVSGLNTLGLTEGGIVYLSPTVAGGYTQTKPSAPNHLVYVGIVTRVHATQGSIQTRIQNGYELDEIHDVAISGVAQNDFLVRNGSNLWVNQSPATARTSLGLGTAATTNSTAYATAAQGAKADTAIQTETDPVYVASSWYSTTNNSANWNTAYGWGNHATAGYLTSYTETDPIYVASSWYSTTNNSANWNTAYGWGNHASAGYASDSTVVKLSGDQTISGTKTFSSTITGSISGNAGTVTNGVVTTGSYADPSWITSLDDGKVLPSMSGNSGKYLTTDGTNSAWATVTVDADPAGTAVALAIALG
jgi:hypothetical protein